jgi:hypothetical protein
MLCGLTASPPLPLHRRGDFGTTQCQCVSSSQQALFFSFSRVVVACSRSAAPFRRTKKDHATASTDMAQSFHVLYGSSSRIIHGKIVGHQVATASKHFTRRCRAGGRRAKVPFFVSVVLFLFFGYQCLVRTKKRVMFPLLCFTVISS